MTKYSANELSNFFAGIYKIALRESTKSLRANKDEELLFNIVNCLKMVTTYCFYILIVILTDNGKYSQIPKLE